MATGLSIVEWNKLNEDDFFHQETNPPENREGGELKTGHENEEPHRPYVHIEPEASKFRKTLGLVVCAHGKLDNGVNSEATLVVVSVHLSCDRRKSRYKSADIIFRFNKRNEGDTPPEVISWAPFNTQERSHETEEEVQRSTNLEATFGAEHIAKADMKAGVAWEVAFKRSRFRRAQSDPLYNDSTRELYGVKWYLEENSNEGDGVAADFHLFFLVKPARNASGAVAPFNMQLQKCRVEAGSWQDFKDALRKFFRGTKVEDAPVILDRTEPLHFHRTGERVKDKVEEKLDNLQTFKGDGMLPLVARINLPLDTATGQT